ncbi:hypothetical protein ABS872_23365, partial [Photorhabdus laumondii]|uniref:hypothetical protein n=1 Tax=Photorhabdus laumondii TaxID=2218628 RepID=UPI00331457ED
YRETSVSERNRSLKIIDVWTSKRLDGLGKRGKLSRGVRGVIFERGVREGTAKGKQLRSYRRSL